MSKRIANYVAICGIPGSVHHKYLCVRCTRDQAEKVANKLRDLEQENHPAWTGSARVLSMTEARKVRNQCGFLAIYDCSEFKTPSDALMTDIEIRGRR